MGLGFGPLLGVPGISWAADDTTPSVIIYEGRLMSSGGTAIITGHTVRLSLWKSADWVSGDETGTGAITLGAGNYGGWNEVHNVTPNSFGMFSVELGSVTSLPTADFDDHKFLQVEVKVQGEADTTYELLDPDTSDANVDRQTLGSIMYAKNAEMLDGSEIGIGSGNLALLGEGGRWTSGQMGSGSDFNTFVLDANDTGGDSEVKFGESNAETLKWENGTGAFALSDGLEVVENGTGTGSSIGLTISQFGIGDALLQLLIYGLQRWVIGIDNDDEDKLKFAKSVGLGSDVVLTLTGTGFVGIGTTTPSEVLEVNGAIALNEVDPENESGSLYATGGSLYFSGSNLISSGSVSGPGSATDNAVVKFDGTDGGTLQNSSVIISDTNYVTGVAGLTVTNNDLVVNGDTIYHGVGFLTDGMAHDQQDIYLTTSGGNVYFELEKVGGGNVEYIFNEEKYILNATSGSGAGGRAQVQLIEGTTVSPVRNYICVTPHVDGETAVLLASTALPTENFAWVGIVTIQSDTEVASHGPLQFQRATEALKHSGRGAMSYVREKLRWLGAKYISGILQTLTITTNGGAADNVVLTTGTGSVFQLHRQSWRAYDISSDGLWVANASGNGTLTKYQKVTDMNQLLETSDGTVIGNKKRAIFVLWGSMNSAGETKMFVNLPSDVYGKDDQAINDRDNFAVTTVPEEFQTTAFMIAKVVLKYETADSGTWINLIGGTNVQDLRGVDPGYNLSGTNGSLTESFSDANFEIFDDGDTTKLARFQASGISTSTIRVFSFPDATGTMCILESDQAWTGSGTFAGRVGIGTTTPDENFDLVGAMNLTPQNSPPASADAGDIYVDADGGNELCFYDGAAWQGISSGTDVNCS